MSARSISWAYHVTLNRAAWFAPNASAFVERTSVKHIFLVMSDYAGWKLLADIGRGTD